VIEKIRGNDYKIQLVGRTKTFRANMLKKYWNWEHARRDKCNGNWNRNNRRRWNELVYIFTDRHLQISRLIQS